MVTAVLAERAEHFLERLRALDGTAEYTIMEHPHLELRVNGPLPPYSFVDAPTSQQAEGGTAERSEPQQPSRTGKDRNSVGVTRSHLQNQACLPPGYTALPGGALPLGVPGRSAGG
jgi:hypothetical protein